MGVVYFACQRSPNSDLKNNEIRSYDLSVTTISLPDTYLKAVMVLGMEERSHHEPELYR